MKIKYNPNCENNLEIIWNKLSLLYSSKADEYIEDQKEKSQLLSYIHSSLNELQTTIENNNLIHNNIIKKVSIEKEHSFLTKKTMKIQNISKSLTNINEFINEFIKKESKTFKKLKNNFIFINKKIINLLINNLKLNISFSGEILNHKNKEKENKKEVEIINLRNLLVKDKKKIKKEDSYIFLVEDYTSKPSFNFYQSYNISLEFNGINLQNEYFLGDNFNKIIFLSALISKNEGIFFYKNIKLEIKGTFHNFTNINQIKCINKNDRINDKFIDLMHNALINGFNIVEMFEKIRIY
ncbi:hypothetical protein TUBRATIS_18920, partial [Tubulinosema ratisbonensis]